MFGLSQEACRGPRCAPLPRGPCQSPDPRATMSADGAFRLHRGASRSERTEASTRERGLCTQAPMGAVRGPARRDRLPAQRPPTGTRQARLPLPSALSPLLSGPGPQSKVEESAWGGPPLRWHSVTAAAMREAGRVRLFFFLLFLLLSGGEASDRAGLVVQAEAGTTLALAGCARAGHSRRDRVASVGPWNRRRPRPPPGPCRRGGPGGSVPSSHAHPQRAMAGQARNGPWRCRGLDEDRFSFSCE